MSDVQAIADRFEIEAQRGQLGRAGHAGPADVLLARQHPSLGLATLGRGDALGLAFGA